MGLSLPGDHDFESVPSIKNKVLRINLNRNIYGTFAEIGAGQETVRQFFRAGGASGTIAKAMSAYDKDFSDSIYGTQDDGRYVTESRLKKCWNMNQILLRLVFLEKTSRKTFLYLRKYGSHYRFCKTLLGHGWIGLRFQASPEEEYSEIILHVRFKERDARSQQMTLGILGTNLIYGAFYKHDNPKNYLNIYTIISIKIKLKSI